MFPHAATPAIATGDKRVDDWWRAAVMYQVYLRSFADGNGDGIGDLAGIRASCRTCASSASTRSGSTRGTRHRWPTRGYDVADYRDIDPLFGTLAEAERLIAEAHAARAAGAARHRAQPPAPSDTRGSGRRSRRARAPSGSGSSSGPAAARRRAAAQRLGQRVRRLRLDAAVARRQPGVVSAPLRPRAAGPELGAPRRPRRVRGRPALLVRPRGRRVPDRRRPRPGQGPGAARPRQAAARRRSTPPRHPVWDRDAVHEIYRAWRRVADDYDPTADVRRRGLGADNERLARTCAPTSCTPPSTSISCGRRGEPSSAARHRRGARPRRRGQRPPDVGAVQPRRAPRRHPATRGRSPTTSSKPTGNAPVGPRAPTSRWAGAEPAPPHC